MDRLELEIPGVVTFPPDGLTSRFKTRRCRIVAASLSLDDQALDSLLGDRAAILRAHGFEALKARILDGAIQVSGRARVGERACEFTASVVLRPEDNLRLFLRDLRFFGYVPKPAPLILHDLLVTLLDLPDLVIVKGPGDLLVKPLEAFLRTSFPASGWRIPNTKGLVIRSIKVGRGRALVNYEPGDDVAESVSSGVPAAEAKLLAGDWDGAQLTYRAELSTRRDTPLGIWECLLAILAAKDRPDEVEELAREVLGRAPDFLPAHLALAQAAHERGRPLEAADHYAEAAKRAEAVGEDEVAVCSVLAAARRLRETQPGRAIGFYERALERRPALVESVEALADLYANEGRYADLVRLSRRRISNASSLMEQAREHLRLGEIYLGKLGDAPRAKNELDKAARLNGTDARVWDSLARVHAVLGEHADAVRALDRLARIHEAKGDAVGEARTHARIAALWETLADPPRAYVRYRRALELLPDDPVLLERFARLTASCGRLSESIGAFEKLAEFGDEGELMIEDRLVHPDRELGRLLLVVGDHDRARFHLNRATRGDHPDFESLTILARLEEQSGSIEAALSVVARATALMVAGPGTAELHLKRAALAERLGHLDDVEDALKRAYALAPDSDIGRQAQERLQGLHRGSPSSR